MDTTIRIALAGGTPRLARALAETALQGVASCC